MKEKAFLDPADVSDEIFEKIQIEIDDKIILLDPVATKTDLHYIREYMGERLGGDLYSWLVKQLKYIPTYQALDVLAD